MGYVDKHGDIWFENLQFKMLKDIPYNLNCLRQKTDSPKIKKQVVMIGQFTLQKNYLFSRTTIYTTGLYHKIHKCLLINYVILKGV